MTEWEVISRSAYNESHIVILLASREDYCKLVWRAVKNGTNDKCNQTLYALKYNTQQQWCDQIPLFKWNLSLIVIYKLLDLSNGPQAKQSPFVNTLNTKHPRTAEQHTMQREEKV